MKMEILGGGCANCARLYENAKKAVSDSGRKATISKVTDYAKIAAYGVMRTPALVIDGEVKSEGRVPSADEIRKMLG
jgi:small redox-active disulfide protein 2